MHPDGQHCRAENVGVLQGNAPSDLFTYLFALIPLHPHRTILHPFQASYPQLCRKPNRITFRTHRCTDRQPLEQHVQFDPGDSFETEKQAKKRGGWRSDTEQRREGNGDNKRQEHVRTDDMQTQLCCQNKAQS